MSIGLALWTGTIEMNALLLISSLPTINAGRAIRNKQVVSCLILQPWISGWFKWDEYRQCQEILVWNKKVRQTSCKTTSSRSSRQSTKTFSRQHLWRKGQYSGPFIMLGTIFGNSYSFWRRWGWGTWIWGGGGCGWCGAVISVEHPHLSNLYKATITLSWSSLSGSPSSSSFTDWWIKSPFFVSFLFQFSQTQQNGMFMNNIARIENAVQCHN